MRQDFEGWGIADVIAIAYPFCTVASQRDRMEREEKQLGRGEKNEMLNVFGQCRENGIKQVLTKVIQDLFHGLLPFTPGSWSLVVQIAYIGCEPTARTFPPSPTST